MDGKFKLVSTYRPTGDQPEAIQTLVDGLRAGKRFQTLEGVTGSGKTFTVANVIQQWGRPTLVVSHNKTLAAQLYAELKGFFPRSAVEYFVSYYDYYQPEAYLPATDTFIEKDSSINEEIERLRLAATDALMNREDVIIVASVSCIYGLGSPEDYRELLVRLQVGGELDREQVMTRLVDIQYTRNDYEPAPGTFRARGDTLDIFPSYRKDGLRVDFFGNRIERLQFFDPTSGQVTGPADRVIVSPAKHFVMAADKIGRALDGIRQELETRVQWFTAENKLLEAQRIRMRTSYDLEMLKELGYCGGIENYSRHLAGRAAGARPACLLDFFPERFLTVVDESHVTVPQLRAMYNGDRARKQVLVDHGFRLPSALDNRPLNFEEFLGATGPILFTTATPGPYELEVGGAPVPQVIRPTGLLDPLIDLRPLRNQIDDLIEEVRRRAAKGERTLVTTLTKKTAEDLSTYLQNVGLRVKYLHSDIDTIERVEILRGLRQAAFDCLVGINLLREGLDLPEVSLVAILDADKEGFLRSETALIQTAGRAARHLNGTVIMYADQTTAAMRGMMEKCRRRREVQAAYNQQHHITPRSIRKSIQDSLATIEEAREVEESVVRETGADYNATELIAELEKEMVEASAALEFERAAVLRDQIHELQASLQPAQGAGRGRRGKGAGRGAARKGGRQPAKERPANKPAAGRKPAGRAAAYPLKSARRKAAG